MVPDIQAEASRLAPERERLLDTLIEAFGMHGYVVDELTASGFLICRFGRSRHCANLAELQAAARRMGVVQ